MGESTVPGLPGWDRGLQGYLDPSVLHAAGDSSHMLCLGKRVAAAVRGELQQRSPGSRGSWDVWPPRRRPVGGLNCWECLS